MKTYIVVQNNNDNIKTAENIKVNDIYGIYQNRCKAFWECKVANLKISEEKKSNKPILLESYVIKEIEVETDNIITTYIMESRNIIVDKSTDIKHKIPTFYNLTHSKDKYDEINSL